MKNFFFRLSIALSILIKPDSSLFANNSGETNSFVQTTEPVKNNPRLNSIEFFIGPVYKVEDRAFYPEIMLEYERKFRINNHQFGLQLGTEILLKRNPEPAISIGLGYEIFKSFDVGLGAKLVYYHQKFATGWSISFERMFGVGRYKLGPVFEYTQKAGEPAVFGGIGMGVSF